MHAYIYSGSMGHRKAQKHQADNVAGPTQFLTSESVFELMSNISSLVKKITQQRRRDRFFFLKERIKKERNSLKLSTLLSRMLGLERCPGLACRIRVVSLPSSGRRSDHLKPHLLLDFEQYPICTEQDLRDARNQPTPEASEYLNTPIKKLTVEVGLSGIRRRKTYKWTDGSRRRFVELLRNRDRKKFKTKRSPRRWRTIYVDPKQSLNEIRLHLLLYLRQEQMIQSDVDEPLRELVEKCFNFKNRFKDGQMVESAESTAFLILKTLLQSFTFPEDWRAMRKYVGVTVRKLRHKETLFQNKIIRPEETVPTILEGTDFRKIEDIIEDPEAAQAELDSQSIWEAPYTRQQPEHSKKLYTVREAADLLQSEKISVSRDRIHDWINNKKIRCNYDDRYVRIEGRRRRFRCLDAEALENLKCQLTAQRQQRQAREMVVNYLVEKAGKEKEAARKYVYRYLQKGKSITEIARRIKSVGGETAKANPAVIKTE
jgi:hypothetical protein